MVEQGPSSKSSTGTKEAWTEKPEGWKVSSATQYTLGTHRTKGPVGKFSNTAHAGHTLTPKEMKITGGLNRPRIGKGSASESDQAEAKEKARKWEVPLVWVRDHSFLGLQWEGRECEKVCSP